MRYDFSEYRRAEDGEPLNPDELSIGQVVVVEDRIWEFAVVDYNKADWAVVRFESGKPYLITDTVIKTVKKGQYR